MNKITTELHRQILNNKFGPGPKFLAFYLDETEKISGKSIVNGYTERLNEFENICEEYKAQIRSSLLATDSNEAASKLASPLVIDTKNASKKKTDALVEKFRTPVGKKTNSVINKNKVTTIDLISENEQEQSKSKKRSAAEISILVDENSELDEESQEVKKNLFKETKKKSKLKNLKKKSEKKSQIEIETSICSVQDSEKLEKKGKNPSKKLKTSEISDDVNDDNKPNKRDETDPMTSKQADEQDKTKAVSKKTGAKKKITITKNSDIEDTENRDECEKKSTKKTKKTKKDKASSGVVENQDVAVVTNKQSTLDPNTPVAKDQFQTKTRLELLQSTVKKTVKKRPMTRRAAAAQAAAAASSTTTVVDDSASNVKASNTFKKFEFGAAKPTLTTTNDSAKTPLVHRNKVISNLLASANKIKPNFRTSIDERKARTSQTKLEAKRKSVKKAQAILQSIHKDRKLSSKFTPNNAHNLLTDDEDDEKTHIKPSKMSTEQEKEIIKNILKSNSPKLVIKKIPVSIINSTNISAVKVSAIVESQCRLTKDLLASNSIQQNYRVMSKMTPCKPVSNNSNSTTGLQQNRTSFIKFLERNTPSKLTKTETEDRQKAELLLKDAKEKERIALLEKQKQEKRDNEKKKREEKMRKINELKAKQQLELEKKKQQQIQEQNQPKVKLLNSNSSNALNSNQNKNQLAISTSSSTSNLTATVKKPIQTNKIIYDQSDLSTFSSDLNNFKQMKQVSMAANFNGSDSENHHNIESKNLETTYVLNSPNKLKPVKTEILSSKPVFTNYQVTPLQPPKLKNKDNYDVSDLKSEDDTDDEDDPQKPIPDWARDTQLIEKVKRQARSMFNFTKCFKSACQSEIILEDIFKTRRKKFTERSSSANWDSTPIWKSNGISGEESFWQFKKQY